MIGGIRIERWALGIAATCLAAYGWFDLVQYFTSHYH
jgi:hypothetical protein